MPPGEDYELRSSECLPRACPPACLRSGHNSERCRRFGFGGAIADDWACRRSPESSGTRPTTDNEH